MKWPLPTRFPAVLGLSLVVGGHRLVSSSWSVLSLAMQMWTIGPRLLLRVAGAAAACTPTSDPQTCANAFLQPFDRPFQIAILVLLGLIGGAALLTGLVSLARGSLGGMFGEPRWVSKAMAGIGGGMMVFVVAVVLVNVFGNLNGLVPTPTLPHLGGGN